MSSGGAVFIMRINFSLAVILTSIFLFYPSRQTAPILSFELTPAQICRRRQKASWAV